MGFSKSGPNLGLEQLIDGQSQSLDMPGMKGSDLTVSALLIDKQGGLWVGTEAQGIYHVLNGTADHFGNSDGLSGDRVASLFEDHEESVWAATADGVDRFHPIKISSLSMREGIVSDNVQSVVRMPDDTMVFATEGGMSFLRNGRLSSIRSGHGFPRAQATSLFVDKRGTLWVGVDNKLTVFANGRFRSVKVSGGSFPGQILDIAEDGEHTIWVLAAGKKVENFSGFKVATWKSFLPPINALIGTNRERRTDYLRIADCFQRETQATPLPESDLRAETIFP